jgi:hypothetical protein
MGNGHHNSNALTIGSRSLPMGMVKVLSVSARMIATPSATHRAFRLAHSRLGLGLHQYSRSATFNSFTDRIVAKSTHIRSATTPDATAAASAETSESLLCDRNTNTTLIVIRSQAMAELKSHILQC